MSVYALAYFVHSRPREALAVKLHEAPEPRPIRSLLRIRPRVLDVSGRLWSLTVVLRVPCSVVLVIKYP